MGKFMDKELPLSLLELLQSQVVNHEHDTRHRDGPNLPLAHSEIMRRSILHRGPNLWMNIPNHLRTTATTNALVNNWRIPREPNPNFLVNLTWRAVKGCVTKILSMGPQELIEVAQP